MKISYIVKIIALLISSLLIAFGICSLIFSYFNYRELKQWHKTHPFDVRVDLSQPGEFSKQFTLNCPYAFSYDLWLLLPQVLSPETEWEELRMNLEVHYSVIDHSGSEIEWLREIHLKPSTKPSEGKILLGTFGRLKENTYTIKFIVSQGVEALSGVEQRLIMDYNIGFAWASPVLALFLGIPSLVIGVISSFLIIKFTRKKSNTHKGNQPAAALDGA